jgi:hypothetical protein
MKLISRLFRTAAPDPMPPPAAAPPAAPTLEERVAALRAEPPELVLRAALGADQDGLQRAAQARLAELLDAGTIAMAALGDSAQVAQLVVASTSARLRQLLAEQVADPEQVRELLNRVRGKDNTVYRILKQKRDAFNSAAREAARVAGEADAVAALLERHCQRGYDAFYTPTFEQLRDRWNAVAGQPDPSLALRAAAALNRCRAVIVAHEQQLAQQAMQRAAEQTAAAARELARQAAEAAAQAEAAIETQQRQAAADALAAEEAVRAAALAAEEQRGRQIGGLIRKAGTALGDGNTKMAAGLRRAIEGKLSPTLVLPAHLARGLQQLDERLHALKEWKDYAVAPKRIELIQAMEALIGFSEAPQALAGRIRALQMEWRTISQGIASDASEEWERFHKAAEAAYQPCREYFEAQALLRAGNLEQRQALLARLRAVAEAQQTETPDWRLITQVLHEAPREWRQHSPVDREANRATQPEFDALIAGLQARLDGWYERNAAEKQALVEQARQLLVQEDGAAAIETVKHLQVLWQAVGTVPRAQDQRLWADFREQCDAIFQKREQAWAEYRTGLDANKAQAVALCESAEQLAALSGAELFAGAANLTAWRSAFAALAELPRAEARGLYTRFERAVERCEAALVRQRARDKEQSVTALLAASQHANAYEWAVASKADPAEQEALRQVAEDFIASVKVWPKGGAQPIRQRMAGATSGVEFDIGVRERALRILCIRCEILLELPTPADDEGLRREYQLQQLVKNMGRGRSADDRDSLLREWIETGAVPPPLYAALTERIRRFLAAR